MNAREPQVEIVRSVGFDSEEQLIKTIVACTKRARRCKYRVELEVDAGVGIADMVLAKRVARTTKALQALASVTPRLAVLLSPQVCNSITSKEDLATSLGTTAGETARVLTLLSSAGLVRRQADSLFFSPITTAAVERIIAAEAKISEWQRVLVLRHGLQLIVATAPQLSKTQRWFALVHYIVERIWPARPNRASG